MIGISMLWVNDQLTCDRMRDYGVPVTVSLLGLA